MSSVLSFQLPADKNYLQVNVMHALNFWRLSDVYYNPIQ